jgi:peptidoglycan/LPS O-acetylase OafA/YrhL
MPPCPAPTGNPVPSTTPTDTGLRLTRTLEHIPALDGARGLAVLLVMGYHFSVPGLNGGFLGVDLFFVLSGFLITTLLVTEMNNKGRIDLGQFWLRRAKRLLPALFLLLAVVVPVTAHADPLSKPGLRKDLIASTLYVANWSFIADGQSYFAEYTAPSPVKHLWSLAIEEQFYVLWPLLIAGACLIMNRAHRPAPTRRALLLLLATGTLASLTALALRWEEADPTASYFATDTRAHELLIGALAAMLIFPRQTTDKTGPNRPARQAGQAVAWAGLAVVLGMTLLVDDSAAPYYHGGSTLFSLGTAALLVGLCLGSGPVVWLLSLPLLVQIGSISYGLYLWHWPMNVWITVDSTGQHGAPLLALRLSATVAVALFSYHLVEMPIRRGSFRGIPLGARRVVIGSVTSIAVLVAGAVVATRGGKEMPEYLKENTSIATDLTAGVKGDKVIGIIGDSVAESIYPGLKQRATERGMGTVQAAFSGCSVGSIQRADDTGKPFGNTRWCAENAARLQTKMVSTYDPGTVLWYSGRERYDLYLEGRLVEAGTPEWVDKVHADWDQVLTRLRAGGARVVLVLPVFKVGENPATCSVPTSGSPDPCPNGNYLGTGPLRKIYTEWTAKHPGEITVVDLLDVLCPDRAAACPTKIDGQVIREDTVHYSRVSASWICDQLLRRLPWLPRVKS